MASKVAMNGLGRIGRATLKLALDQPLLELVAVNEIGSLRSWCTSACESWSATSHDPAGR
jgi:glyceraldehyde-3-phosphate dehydrogenase/erythrose-4-phosphate dehydrogenase